jgi:hypothetical protein
MAALFWDGAGGPAPPHGRGSGDGDLAGLLAWRRLQSSVPIVRVSLGSTGAPSLQRFRTLAWPTFRQYVGQAPTVTLQVCRCGIRIDAKWSNALWLSECPEKGQPMTGRDELPLHPRAGPRARKGASCR